MPQASCRRHRSGSKAKAPCRQNPSAAMAGRPNSCVAIKSIGLCRSKSLRWVCRNRTWETITWREGACEPLSSRFARVRVRPAHRDYDLTAPRPEEWLLIEWPEREAEPTKYWFSTLPEDIDFTSLVGITKLRWRIERDYLDLKQEIGIGHYEGRGWRGFHHHATLCIAAYAFLILERETIPPSGPRRARQLEKAEVPEGYKPRGHAPQAGEAYAELYRDTQTQDRRGPGESPPTMSLLRRRQTKSNYRLSL